MPRLPTLLSTGVALLLAGACSATSSLPPAPSPSPSPAPLPPVVATPAAGTGNAPWALNLDFSGDLAAHVTGTAQSDDTLHNECTGTDSGRLGSWASTMAFTAGQRRYALVVLVTGYRGAATFTSGLKVEVSSQDQVQVWQNGPGDQASFTVGVGETSGLISATLSNAAAVGHKLVITGHWSCLP